MHRPPTFALAALVLVLAACTSGPAASPAPGATQVPGQPTPTAVLPTSAPMGNICAGVPTFSLSGETPTFTRDTQLEARFPATIDGQPIENLSSGFWYENICYFSGQAGVDRNLAELPPGLNVNQMSFASADFTVDDEEVSLTAFRTPGQDANSVLQALIALGNQTEEDAPINLQPAVVGGKSVLTATDEEGDTTYAYVTGDTMFFLDGITESQAGKMFAALP